MKCSNKIDKLSKFIVKSKNRHGEKYDYSKVEYLSSKTKVEIICQKHGSFFVRPDAHVRKVGCSACNGGVLLDKEKFLLKAKEVFLDKYDYSKVDYKNSICKIEILCLEHGSFFIRPANHLQGQGCSKCSGNFKKDSKEFVEKSTRIHNFKYDYSKVFYTNNRSPVTIICPKHGEFKQIPKEHQKGRGCKFCKSSLGESRIESLLLDLGVEFEREKKFEDCVGKKKKLPFDFFLPGYNICVEFDGKLHFENVFGEKTLEDCRRNDEIKESFCSESQIRLVRISYLTESRDVLELIKLIISL